MTPEHLQTTINLFMYCIANETTPSGGLKFQSWFEEFELDGTTQSIFRLDKLLNKVRQQLSLTELLASDDGKNFIKAVAIYIGCFLNFQLEDYAEDVSWQDTYDTLSKQKVHEDSILWFTSLKIIIDQHSFKPVYLLKEFFEQPDQECVSKHIFEFLSNTHTDIITTRQRQKEQLQQQASTDIKLEHADADSSEHYNTHPFRANTDIAINNMHQNPIYTSDNTEHALKTINANNDDAEAAKLSFFELQQLLESQKHELQNQQNNPIPKSNFAKVFKNPFKKTSLPKYSAHLDNNNKEDYKEIEAKPVKVQDEINFNKQQSKLKQTESIHNKDANVNSEPQPTQQNDKEISESPSITKSQIKKQNLILVQLFSDKYNPDFVLENEQSILPELSEQEDETKFLNERVAAGHAHAMFVLSCIQLEQLKMDENIDFSLPFHMKEQTKEHQKVLTNCKKLLIKTAMKENAASQYFIAQCYREGFLFEKNETTSNKWLRLAVANKHPKAIQTLANDTKATLNKKPLVASLSNIDDKIILWIAGILSFAVGLIFLF